MLEQVSLKIRPARYHPIISTYLNAGSCLCWLITECFVVGWHEDVSAQRTALEMFQGLELSHSGNYRSNLLKQMDGWMDGQTDGWMTCDFTSFSTVF